MNQINTKLLLLASCIILILSGCGKYDEGPGISLRTKNSRLEGKWKVVSIKKEYTDPNDPNENTSDNFDGTTWTYSYNVPVYDPVTSDLIGYEIVNESSSYSSVWEFNTKDNTRLKETTENGVGSTSTSFWTWKDGTSAKEMLHFGGQYPDEGSEFLVKKLTNKELILYYEYTDDEDSYTEEYKLEKVK
jgi:hypothetical protein